MAEKFDLNAMLKEIDKEKNLKGPESGSVSQEEIAKRLEQKKKVRKVKKEQEN